MGHKKALCEPLQWLARTVLSAPAYAAVSEYERQVEAYNETLQSMQSMQLRDTETRLRFLSEIETAFLSDYKKLWAKEDMSVRLSEAIDRAMAGVLDKSCLPDMLQVAMDLHDTQREIQKNIPEEFASDYQRFVQNLEEYFAKTYVDKLLAYDRALLASRLGALDSVPAARTFFEEIVRIGEEREFNRLHSPAAVQTGVRPKLSWGRTTALVGMSLGGAFLVHELRRNALSVVGSGLGRKVLMGATGIATAISAGWALYDLGSFGAEIWNSPAKLREALVAHCGTYYQEQCPKNDWQSLREGVRKELDELLARVARYDEDTKAILASSAFWRLTEELTEEQQKHFIDRLIRVRPLDGTVSYDDLLDNFGEMLPRMKQKNVGTFRDLLSSGDILLVRQWLNLVGEGYFDLYRALPAAVWRSYMPSADALEVLNWLARLPKNFRSVLGELSMERARWVMLELPAQQIGELCSRTKQVSQISQEVERLKTLDPADRQPWQSDEKDLLHRVKDWLLPVKDWPLRAVRGVMYWLLGGMHLRIVGWVVGAVFVLWVCRRVLHLF